MKPQRTHLIESDLDEDEVCKTVKMNAIRIKKLRKTIKSICSHKYFY